MIDFYGPWGRFNLQAKIEWEALRRNPEFRFDCDKATSSSEKERIAAKWGLRELFDYNSPIWDPKEEAYPIVFTKRFSSIIILYGYKLEGIIDKNVRIPACTNLHLFENRFLPLLIDLSSTKEVILQEISNLLEEYLSFVKKPKNVKKPKPYRDRGPSLDIYLDETPASGPISIFQVWEMNKWQGKSPWKIAQELYPELAGKSYQGHASNYDSNARRLKKQISDAIDRADGLITSIIPTS